MATSDLTVTIKLTTGVVLTQSLINGQNVASPGQIELQDLVMGDNTFTVPAEGGATTVTCVVVPPVGNTDTITLKGAGGDTGISLHLTNPSVIGLNSVSSIILNAGAAITGVRLFFI